MIRNRFQNLSIYLILSRQSLEKSSKDENKKWEEGLVSGAVYGGEAPHNEILNKVYSLYSLSNPLHPDIWPKVNQCEAEVIAMTANLLNGGDQNVVGTMTSGGTESIIMAVRAHLEYYGNKRGIEYPCIISSTTAHAGLNKGCEMFGISLIQIDCGDKDGYVLKAAKVRKCMTSNVIMIYSSAPCFPQGVIDPIEELSDLALEYDVGLHVDACLGGFVLPFAKMLNYEIPNFDFGCAGVTSMSADTHKYGYASKGTSVVLYRNKVSVKRCTSRIVYKTVFSYTYVALEKMSIFQLRQMDWRLVQHSYLGWITTWSIDCKCMGISCPYRRRRVQVTSQNDYRRNAIHCE